MKYGDGVIDQQRSGRWRARRPDGKGGYITIGTFDTIEEAKEMLAAAAVAKSRMPDKGANILDYGWTVLRKRRLEGKKDWKGEKSRWNMVKKHCEWAQWSFDMCNRGVLKDSFTDLLEIENATGELYSQSSVKHALDLSRAVFQDAVDHELIDINPLIGVKPPGKKAPKDNWESLTEPEIDFLARCNRLTRFEHDKLGVPWGTDEDLLTYEQCTALLFVVFTGLRQGECAALLWTDVIDLDGAEPHLRITKSWSSSTTKTGKDRRVNLIPAAVELLKRWRAHMTGSVSKSVWGHHYGHGYDWGWAAKTELSTATPTCWLGVRQKLGITRRVTFHHLRDTCASHLLSGTWGFKWTIAEVATLLGHSTTYVTERYARIMPGTMAEIARNTYRKPAANLPQPKAQTRVKKSAEASGITAVSGGRAIRDSNTGLLAPEANALSS